MNLGGWIMGLDLIPAALRKKFRFDEREHATAILATDFKKQFKDILDCMAAFTLKKSYFAVGGGARSPIPEVIDGFLQGASPAQFKTLKANAANKLPKRAPTAPIGPTAGRGWKEKKFDIEIRVDGGSVPIPTHKIDNFLKLDEDERGVGVEVEWNNKTEFYDRDLNNFRLLRQLGVLSVGVIITRCSELQTIFDEIGRGDSFGNSTTHWDKLIPKVDGGGAGGCPLLLIGLGHECYDPDS
jgi:hypothetical protein